MQGDQGNYLSEHELSRVLCVRRVSPCASQVYIERRSFTVPALHYGLAHKIKSKRSKNYGNKRH